MEDGRQQYHTECALITALRSGCLMREKRQATSAAKTAAAAHCKLYKSIVWPSARELMLAASHLWPYRNFGTASSPYRSIRASPSNGPRICLRPARDPPRALRRSQLDKSNDYDADRIISLQLAFASHCVVRPPSPLQGSVRLGGASLQHLRSR